MIPGDTGRLHASGCCNATPGFYAQFEENMPIAMVDRNRRPGRGALRIERKQADCRQTTRKPMRSTLTALLCSALLAFLPLAGAGLLDKEISFSEAEVQAALARNSRVEKQYAGLLTVALREVPTIRLGIPEGRAGIAARMEITLLGNPPIPVDVRGHAGIRYDDQAKAFYLESPVAEAVESAALPREAEPGLRRAVTQLMTAYFRSRPVYVLREDGSAQEIAARWLLRAVRFEPGKVVATLAPL